MTSSFFFPRIFQKIETSESITLLSFTGKLTWLFLLEAVNPSPDRKMIKLN